MIVTIKREGRRKALALLAGLAFAVGLWATVSSSGSGLDVRSPGARAGGVLALPVYGEIELQAPRPLRAGAIRVFLEGSHVPVPGRTEVAGRTIRFIPEGVFQGGRFHDAAAWAETDDGQRLTKSFRFRTEPMQERLWVDVRLTVPQHVVVYRDGQEVRRMLTSAGRADDPTPLGVYRLQNRGERFFSARYQQGGYYWVRFQDNYLFHSIPFDSQGRIIEEEAAKLGCPASHGCLRLSLEDAEWFYHNVPDGTMVVIRH